MPLDFSDGDTAIFLQLTIQNYVEVISLATLHYDYLLTFDLEVERFWRRPKLSLVPILFFVNRYGVIIGYAPTAVILLRPEILLWSNNCYIYYRVFTNLRLAFAHTTIAAILVLRTSALYAHSRRVVVSLAALIVSMIIHGAVLWALMDKADKLRAQENLCINAFDKFQGNQLVGLWVGLFVLDCIVFSLTLRKTLALLREFPDSFTLWSALIRDGAIYFGVLSITNFANILMLLLGPSALKALLTDVINVLASALISRLMLNLRDKSVTKLHSDTLTTRAIDAPIQFAPRMPNRNANTTGFSAFSWKSDISSTILNA